jgi:polar amino acid transport system substrate-binding protein
MPSLFRLWSLRLLLCGMAQAMCSLAVQAAEVPLRAVTEELPPYNMMEDGALTGLGTEVVQAVMKEAGVQAPIKVMPWARAYDMALNEEGVMIYSIARTPQREKLFKWVGVIAPVRWALLAQPGRHWSIKRLEDARKYQVATVNEAVGEQYLINQGFELGKNLQSSAKYSQNYDKLKLGRVDLWIANELNAAYICRSAGDDPTTALVRVLTLPDLAKDGGLYLAFSPQTPDATVERFRKALDTLRHNGVYDALQKKWL